MELTTFSENIVIETFERNGETVELKLNIDAIVPGYYDQLEERLQPLVKRFEALKMVYDSLSETQESADDQSKKKRGKMPSMLKLEKEIAEIRRETFAERLTCPVKLPDGSYTTLLKGWSVTENGLGIEPSKSNLMRLPPQLVEELWDRSLACASTVKKRVDAEIAETSENSPSGTRGLHAVGQTG